MSVDSNKEYSVNWKNHMIHVRKAFDNLLTSNELTDVTLYCEGQKIGAHKILLSACSAYFRDTFKDVPSPHPVIVLYGVEYGVLTDILHFIYNGEVSVDTAKLDAFLKTAQLLQISGLTDDVNASNEQVLTESESSTNSQQQTRVEEQPEACNTQISTSSAVKENKKVAKRMRSVESEVGPTHTKVGRQDSDSFFISDVKSEPGELANFEDPLEDPLLQADQSNDTKEFFAAGQGGAEEEFKSDIVIEQYGSNRTKKRRRFKPSAGRFTERHFPQIIPPTTKAKPTKRCVLCHKKGKRKESRYWCEQCGTGLCPAPCFGMFHQK